MPTTDGVTISAISIVVKPSDDVFIILVLAVFKYEPPEAPFIFVYMAIVANDVPHIKTSAARTTQKAFKAIFFFFGGLGGGVVLLGLKPE